MLTMREVTDVLQEAGVIDPTWHQDKAYNLVRTWRRRGHLPPDKMQVGHPMYRRASIDKLVKAGKLPPSGR